MGDNEGFEVVKRAIAEINEDEDVDGLIVYFPLFGPEKDDELRALISPRVDVEGVHSENLSESYAAAPPSLAELSTSMSDAIIYPCTPLVVLLILESLEGVYEASAPAGQRLNGEIITVINRSETVGRPLAAMLANESALVLSLDISSSQIYQPVPYPAISHRARHRYDSGHK